MKYQKIQSWKEGMQAGIPIALGYLAVSFSLGIAAQKAGLTAIQGFFTSLFVSASAGEYAGFTVIAANAPYLDLVLITLIVNARYFLMSCALSQRVAENMSMFHRLFLGFYLTDEIFGLAISRPGKVDPYFSYGAMTVAIPCWAIGTFFGIVMGNILPFRVVSALSVALYGMFLAIIIPPARENKVIALMIVVSFFLSYLLQSWKVFVFLSSSGKVIVLTLVISVVAAILCPVKEEEDA